MAKYLFNNTNLIRTFMTNAALEKIMDELKGEVRTGFKSLGEKVENVDTRLTRVETTLKNIGWAVLALIALGGVVTAIIYH